MFELYVLYRNVNSMSTRTAHFVVVVFEPTEAAWLTSPLAAGPNFTPRRWPTATLAAGRRSQGHGIHLHPLLLHRNGADECTGP